jgi:hypothetical protein
MAATDTHATIELITGDINSLHGTSIKKHKFSHPYREFDSLVITAILIVL